jgi:transcriptional regulator with XRE-family HTH domain
MNTDGLLGRPAALTLPTRSSSRPSPTIAWSAWAPRAWSGRPPLDSNASSTGSPLASAARTRAEAMFSPRSTAKAISLTELADRLGISKGYLSSLETGGDVNPTVDILFKIAKGLGVTLADILGQPKTKAKPAIPTELPEGLRDLIEERRRTGAPLEDTTVFWLAQAQFRGRRPTTKQEFEYLLQSLRLASGERIIDEDGG